MDGDVELLKRIYEITYCFAPGTRVRHVEGRSMIDS
jgi:hypothetical protein